MMITDDRKWGRWIPVLLAATVLFSVTACSTSRLPSWTGFAGPAQTASESVPWVTSWPKAKVQAATEDKIVMLWFTGSDWCKYCRMLEREVFNTEAFHDWYAGNIVPVEVDFPRKHPLPPDVQEQNEQLRDRYSDLVTSYPTVLFVDDQGQVMGKMGYQSGGPEAWIAQAESMLNVAW